jgi:hypothetical protein
MKAMFGQRFFTHLFPFVHSGRLLAALALATSMAVVLVWLPAGTGETPPPLETTSPAEHSPPGPACTDFNSRGYTISSVVRTERLLNALGIAARLARTRKIGMHTGLPKELAPSDRGEDFTITWKYSPEHSRSKSDHLSEHVPDHPSLSKPQPIPLPPKATLKFDYKLSNEEDLQSITWEYPHLTPGTYSLRIDNTGEGYRRRGRIQLWRASIFAHGDLVARKQSFLWSVLQGNEEISPDK